MPPVALPHCTLDRFQLQDQVAARALILTGLGERWGWIDESLNPDLDDIARHYAPGLFLVARLDGELVGTCALLPEPETTLPTARIVRMSVRRDVRGQGIGRAILTALCDAAVYRGYQQLVLETTSTWTDAIGFYTRYGFTWVGEHAGETHMRLPLDAAGAASSHDARCI